MAGRPPLDTDPIIADAMTVFWQKGFQGASISDLEAGTGVTRFSLYRKFGDKAGLLEAALARYLDHAERVFEAELAGGDLDAVLQFLDWFADERAGVPEDQFGCLAVNLGVEAHDLPRPVLSLLTQYRAMMRRLIRGALHGARARGQVADDFDIDANAEMIAIFIDGCAHTQRLTGKKSSKAAAIGCMKDVVASWRYHAPDAD